MDLRRLRRLPALCLVAAAAVISAILMITPVGSASATPRPGSGSGWGAVPAAAPAGPVASTSFSYTSEPGDWVGGGGSEKFVPSATTTVTVWGTDQHLQMRAVRSTEEWDADVAPGLGDRLRPGVFSNAQSYPFQTGRAPGLDVGGDARGCDGVGSFTIHQIAFDATGAITMADVSITQHCEAPDAPALTATIHLNQYPYSYKQASDKNDYIGRGHTKTYDNSTSLMTFTALTTKLIRMRESGLGDTWAVDIKAPTGKTLLAGKTYTTSITGTGTRAGLAVHGDGRTCKSTTGTLTLAALTVSATGRVTHFSATFTQHCNGKKPALHGTLHYFA